jgi:hypothetical protein
VRAISLATTTTTTTTNIDLTAKRAKNFAKKNQLLYISPPSTRGQRGFVGLARSPLVGFDPFSTQDPIARARAVTAIRRTAGSLAALGLRSSGFRCPMTSLNAETDFKPLLLLLLSL